MIREATPADYTGGFAVMRSAYPEFVTTEAGFRHRQVTLPPEARAGGWVAEEDGRAVAVTYTAADYPGARVASAFTGVLPEHRGRGYARLVKLAVIRHLASRGVALLVTDNDERNAPLLAVNTRLGFAPYGADYAYVRESGNGLRASAGST